MFTLESDVDETGVEDGEEEEEESAVAAAVDAAAVVAVACVEDDVPFPSESSLSF